MNKDIFIISAKAEAIRFSRLMNKASREYWKLKDRNSPYGKMLYGCYYMNRMNHERTLETIKEYEHGKIINE